MENIKDKVFIENENGTVEELGKEETSIKGDFSSVAKVFTAPTPIRTFEAIEVNEDLKKFVVENGSMTGNENEVCYMVFDDGITSQALVLNNGVLSLKGSTKDSVDGEYDLLNIINIVLKDGEHIARYDGLFNKVNNVIPYTEEIEKLSKLLK